MGRSKQPWHVVNGTSTVAAKPYRKGDVFVEENPIVVLGPQNDEEANVMLQEFLGKQGEEKNDFSYPGSLYEAIEKPATVTSTFMGRIDYVATFRGMVLAGLWWLKREPSLDEGAKKSILELYHPLEYSQSAIEKDAIIVSVDARDFVTGKKNLDDAQSDVLRRIMLIWNCNAFEGGRIYPKISRVNHDCNPNAVILSDGEKQKLAIATDIEEGEEITISYLGLLLYTETKVRQDWLQKHKVFFCECRRCTSREQETTARLPCFNCHPRVKGRAALKEDDQYDDEQTVQYSTMDDPCPKCNAALKKKHTIRYCGKLATEKALAILNDLATKKTQHGDDDDELLEEQLSLASSVMGDKHWSTNLLRLLYLDRQLKSMSQAMLTTQALPKKEELGQAIDSLQRLARFVEAAGLKLDAGHVLGDVTIGVARLLISLGDLKSQKYGAEWLEKMSDYVDHFESDGRQKVVASLRVAWKSNAQNTENEGCAASQVNKKAKK